MRKSGLHTVCQEAGCPNVWECFSNQTATFMILGDQCTRNCRFCAVGHETVVPPDPKEPAKVAEAAESLGLQYVVITSVTRDDLNDGGADMFAETIKQLRKRISGVQIEVLIPDFQGDADALNRVVSAGPDVLNHNIETVPRRYPSVRPEADYQRSLALLQRVRKQAPFIPTKSGIMLGLGETEKEVLEVLGDLRHVDCRILTLGQYLQPSKDHIPINRFVRPGEFDDWRKTGLAMGFSEVASGPLVRSSYHARELFQRI
jgi:lipoyl synthase